MQIVENRLSFGVGIRVGRFERIRCNTREDEVQREQAAENWFHTGLDHRREPMLTAPFRKHGRSRRECFMAGGISAAATDKNLIFARPLVLSAARVMENWFSSLLSMA